MAQVNVKSFFGSSDSWGKIVAEVGMFTNYGYIMGISGGLLNVGSGVNESSKYFYDFECSIHSGAAMNRYSWPTGVNCFPINRHITNPLGNVFDVRKGTGYTYYTGDHAISFGR